ncbi:hypothetical protein IE53DRAFT_196417 [Violaceomyces palustris]|uniref:Uncharacterized protein n=1 Tax=Violaceomyces palustris TaxID=1673888 RepID=A0ACD0P5L8_9BASI|nr:hypothetical protein IE53DRAFT_196417 [Violaceomyces palustris]
MGFTGAGVVFLFFSLFPLALVKCSKKAMGAIATSSTFRTLSLALRVLSLNLFPTWRTAFSLAPSQTTSTLSALPHHRLIFNNGRILRLKLQTMFPSIDDILYHYSRRSSPISHAPGSLLSWTQSAIKLTWIDVSAPGSMVP